MFQPSKIDDHSNFIVGTKCSHDTSIKENYACNNFSSRLYKYTNLYNITTNISHTLTPTKWV